AHEDWTHGRAADAARLLSSIASRPEFAVERRWTLIMLGGMRLALGQIRLAEEAFSHIEDSDLRAVEMASVALARNDPQAVAARLKEYRGTDFWAVSTLVRAGDLDAADRILTAVAN